ncbi:30S ribosomal protein S13 [Candidatus Dependentiae bacterium]
MAARIEGVMLPGNKRVEYGLTYLHGIGLKCSKEILEKLEVNFDTRIRDLTDEQVAAIQKEISGHYVVEGALRKKRAMDIRRLQEIESYRGLRHKKGLPVRGQRTKTNARTRKGPKGRAVAKKKVSTKK